MVKPYLRQETFGGKTWWFRARRTTRLKPPIIHLLPNYDEYLVAYRDHSPSVDPSLRETVRRDNDALQSHIVVLNGRVVGGWQRTIKKDEVVIELNLLKRLAKSELDALGVAAEHYGRFIGKSVTLT
jgi:hypothetical protein